MCIVAVLLDPSHGVFARRRPLSYLLIVTPQDISVLGYICLTLPTLYFLCTTFSPPQLVLTPLVANLHSLGTHSLSCAGAIQSVTRTEVIQVV